MRKLFGYTCLVCGGAGAVLTIHGGDALAAALPPEFPEWQTDPVNSTYNHTIERGERYAARRISSITTRIGVVVLFVSLGAGLVINFPNIVIGSLGVLATLAITGFGIWYGLKIPDLRYRIHIWKRMQHLRNTTHGNVIGQNAVIELRAAFEARRSVIREAGRQIERFIRDQEASSAERKRHDERQRREAASSPSQPDVPPPADS